MHRGIVGYSPAMDYDRYRKLPNALRKYRKERGLSQIQVARLLGFKDKTWISHWENGDAIPSLVSAIRLSKVCGTSIESLFPDLVDAV